MRRGERCLWSAVLAAGTLVGGGDAVARTHGSPPGPEKPRGRVRTANPPPRRAADANWVVVAPNRRYLMLEDGRSFMPIGIATSGDLINLDYFGAAEIGGRAIRFADDHLESLLADMQAHGENFLRIDIEGTGHLPRPDAVRLIRNGKIGFLESRVGVFNEDYARRVDRLIALADKHDVYLDLVLIAHTCDLTRPRTGDFDLYPYSAAEGGPLGTMDDLFASPVAREAWLRRLRYISDRWGGSRRIAMWELYNELLNCGGTNAKAAADWVAEMGQALRKHEVSRYGKAHPVIVSTVSFVPEQRFFADSPGTDLMVTHFYGDAGDSGNPVEVAKAIHRGVLENLSSIDYSRPFLENERTLSRRYPDDVQRKMEHAAAWSEVASGAASPGASWFVFGEATPFRDKSVVSDTNKAMRRILDTISFARFDSRPVDVPSGNPEVLPMVVSDGSTAIGWLLHDDPDDYDIENIEAWRSGRIRDEVAGVQAIGNWVRIVDERGGSPQLDAHFERLGAAIAARTGLSPSEAAARAKEALRTPAKAAGFLQRIAAVKGREVVRQKIRQGLDAVVTILDDIERRQRILKRAYRGHPRVTSRLTLGGLRPGPHRVVWYDDGTGEVVREDSVHGAEVTLSPPPFSQHIAFTLTSGPEARERPRS